MYEGQARLVTIQAIFHSTSDCDDLMVTVVALVVPVTNFIPMLLQVQRYKLIEVVDRFVLACWLWEQ